jgi:RNA polymerase sigma-70 factor (ECF subfamily)
VSLSDIDRNLLRRCLARKPRAWNDFVDRFVGLVVHVINHTAQSRSIRLSREDREDLAADVFLAIVKDDFTLLRRFRGESSLATYLTVVARRVVVRQLLTKKSAMLPGQTSTAEDQAAFADPADGEAAVEQRLSDQEEVARLLEGLNDNEADVVRMYHLEGKTYREISDRVGLPENSIGPTLSRARTKLRSAGANSAAQ